MPNRNTIQILITAKDETSKVLSEVQKNLNTIGTVSLAAISAGVAAAGAAVTAFATQSLNEFSKFEKGIQEVLTLIPNASAEMRDKLSQDAMDIAARFGTLPEDVLPAMYQALSAGVPADNVFDFLETASKAAMGGVANLETTVDGITSVVNAYGESVLDANQASDIMFTTLRLGKTDFTQLSSSLFNVVPVAASLGVAFGDVGAGLATITAQGTPTTVATTQLRQMFVELGNDTTKVGSLFKELSGQSFPDFITSGGNTADVLAILSEHASANNLTMAQLFSSIEAGQAALGLTGANAESFSAALEEMENAAGATQAAYEQMAAGIIYETNRFNAKLSILKVTVGEKLAPAFETVIMRAGNFVSLLTELAKGTNVLDEDFKEFDLGVLEPLGITVAKLFNSFNRLVGVFRHYNMLVEAGIKPIESFHSALFLAFGKQTADNITGLVNVFVQLKNTFMPLVNSVLDFIRTNVKLSDVLMTIGIAISTVIVPAFVGMIAAISPIIATFALVTGAIALVRTAFETDFLGIRTLVENVFSKINEFVINFKNALELTQNPLSAFSDALRFTFSPEIASGFDNFINGAIDKFNLLKDMFGEIGQFIRNAVRNLMPKTETGEIDVSGIAEFAKTVFSLLTPLGKITTVLNLLGVDLEKVFKDGVAWVTDFFATLNGESNNPQALALIAFFENVQKTIDETVIPAIENFKAILSNIWNDVSAGLTELSDWFNVTQLPRIQELIETKINPAIQAFVNLLSGIWDSVSGGLSLFFDNTASEGSGFNLIETAVNIAKFAIDGLITVLTGIWDLVGPTLTKLFDWFATDGLPLIGEVVKTVSQTIGKFFNYLGTIWELVSPALTTFFDWFTETGLPAIGSFIADTFMPVFRGMVTNISLTWVRIGSALGSVYEWFTNTGLPAIQSVIETVTRKFNEFTFTIQTIWDNVSGALSSLFDWFNTNGMPIIKSAVDGVKDAIQVMINLLSGIWDTVKAPLESFVNGISDLFGGIKNTIIQPISDAIYNMGISLGNLIEQIKGAPAVPQIQPINPMNPHANMPGFANGIAYVPRDNMIAKLHQGERVLTRRENEEFSQGTKNTININITGNFSDGQQASNMGNEIVTQLRLRGVQI